MLRVVAITIVTALLAAGTAQAEPAVPTFVNGLSQAVFAQDSANWVNHELWVETTMDSDFDGRLDRVHVDVSRPMETQGAKAVVDWLNGRATGYTTRTGDVEVSADWTTGKVGMIGTSYNGTL